MTDKEIIERLIQMQVLERMSQKKLSDLFRMSLTSFTTILNGKQKICPSRRKKFEMAFKLYDQGLLR